MRMVIATLAMLVLAMPALAADVAKDINVVIEGASTPHDDVIVRGDVAQVNILDGAFTDLSDYWAGGLADAGYTPDIYYDPMGGIDYSPYQSVTVDCSDNWWPSANYPMEQTAWRSYLDGQGNMILVGQDFLYGSGDLALLRDYFGVGSIVEDVNYGDTGTLTWTGNPEGPLQGLSGSMTPCFWTNPWYSDHVTPSAYAAGVATWSTPTYAGGEAGSALNWPGRIFSTVEFGCGGVDVVYSMVLWFYFIVATDKTSFSMVKALYK